MFTFKNFIFRFVLVKILERFLGKDYFNRKRVLLV